MNFNTNSWMKNQYLREAGLQESLAQQINQVLPENLGYKEFAQAVADILKDEYGSQNFNPFIDILRAELGMKESVNENEKSLGEEFSIKFNVPASSDRDSITIRTKDIIGDKTAEKMIKWIESKDYIVDREQSNFDYDYEPGERDFWPRIRFNKK